MYVVASLRAHRYVHMRKVAALKHEATTKGACKRHSAQYTLHTTQQTSMTNLNHFSRDHILGQQALDHQLVHSRVLCDLLVHVRLREVGRINLVVTVAAVADLRT